MQSHLYKPVFKLNYASTCPLCLQLAYLLQKAIKNGFYTKAARLPTVKELSQELGVSASVPERAYALLLKRNVVERCHQHYYLVC